MSSNNVINEKKKALLAYKEKILDEIKYYERGIKDLRANVKNNNNYDDHTDSSDSEDDFPLPINAGPSVADLKLQQSMMKTCLQATEELTSLTILQSSVDVLVDEPKFEGERPVKEAGTWREVIAECRIDLIHFTMTFFMHTPERKFGPPSYRGLRVVPVKPGHEAELTKSVLHSLKVPSDAVEVLRSYAAGYRSRRTTLARLANKYTNALFMEPHPEGGFVMKCADLLEVSWRLENKRSPVAPFHHTMKFDLEFMEESYVKIIAQAHKQLLNPAIPTDERTLLLAKIIATCLEARGPIDPESDLESKTTERDNDIDKRDSDTEKKDSEVMAPPKSLPKKGKQKNKEANTAQKRSIDEDNDDSRAKKMKNAAPEAKKSIVDANNPRKTKMNDGAAESGKKRKISEVNKAANAKNVKGSDSTEDRNVNSNEDQTGNNNTKNTTQSENNVKNKNLKEAEEKSANTNSKPKNMKESVSNDDKNSKTRNQITKETGETVTKTKNTKQSENNVKNKNLNEAEEKSANTNSKPKNMKESFSNDDKNSKTKNLITKETGETVTKTKNTKQSENNVKNKNLKEAEEKSANTNSKPKNMKESVSNDDKNSKTKNQITKETEETVTKESIPKPRAKNVKEPTNLLKEPSKIDIDTKPKTKIVKKTGKTQEKDASDELTEKNTKEVKNKGSVTKNNMNKEPDNTEKGKSNINKAKTVPTKETGNSQQNNKDEKAKNIEKKKPKTVANTKSKENIDANKDAGHPVKSKLSEKNTNNEKNIKTQKIANKPKDDSAKAKNVPNTKNDNQATKKTPERNINVASTGKDEQPKKVLEKKIVTKEKVSDVANKGAEKNIKEKTANTNVKNVTQIVKKVAAKNATNVINKDKVSEIANKVTEKIIKEKPAQLREVPEKVLSSNLISKKTKEPINIAKNATKKQIITKIASHRNSLKPQNPPKVLKADNTKAVATGNTEKENGGKGSKIPQKKMSIISEGSSKRNMLRISPRKLPSKYKTISQEKQKMVKSTNIPRLLKKPAPKTTNGKFK